MFLYVSIIIIAIILTALFNSIFYVGIQGFFGFLLLVFLLTLVEILIDSFCAFFVRRILPENLFSVDKQQFSAKKKEVKFYEKIRIRKWKDKTLELGALTGFRKNKLGNVSELDYIKRFIIEANYGVVVHVACVVFGFLIILFCPRRFAVSIGLPIAIINTFLNMMSLFILRYNLPKLHKVYKFNLKKISCN